MRNDIHSQIKAKIDSFAGELEALVRQAALSAVSDSLGTTKPRVGRPPGKAVVSSAASSSSAKRPAKNGRRRRSAEELEAAATEILKHIKSNPGLRSEEIRDALSIDKNVWVPAITTLLSDKKVSKKGVKRSTTYTAK
jgi:hypothetical protein